MSFTTKKILRFACCFSLAVVLYGATGKVVYSGSAVGTAGAYGSTLSQAFDRDVTTVWYGANPNGAWAGTDFGASTPVQLTAYRIGNAIVGSSGQKNELAGGTIQASNDCSFASGVATLDTIPSPAPGVAYLARYTMAARNERAISPSSAYRCYRYVSAPNGYGGVSELQWIGSAGSSGLSARPVMPVLSPGSGTFPNGSATVSITSQTTSASIYYTTDGSTPTNLHGTLYSGPFSLSVGSATVLQAVAYDATLGTPLSDVVTGNFRNYAFKPNDNWYDDDGILIEAHAADVSGPFNGKYYMVGQFSNKGNNTNDIPGNEGIWMYSSADLLNWHWEGQIIDTGASAGTAWRYVGRPHILRNAANNNYVLWAHMDNNHDSTDRAGVATASNPTGPWTWQTVTLNPDNNGFKDFSLFEDVNGTAYVAYVTQCGGCGAQGATTISKLTDNYQASSGSSITGLINGQEAPVLLQRNGVYFLISSGADYYDSVNTAFVLRYIVCSSCSSPLGAWGGGTGANLFAATPVANNPYNGQSSSILVVQGRQDAYLLLTDFWNPTSLYNSRQTWMPLIFPTGTTVQASTPAVFDLTLWPSSQRVFPMPSPVGK